MNACLLAFILSVATPFSCKPKIAFRLGDEIWCLEHCESALPLDPAFGTVGAYVSVNRYDSKSDAKLENFLLKEYIYTIRKLPNLGVYRDNICLRYADINVYCGYYLLCPVKKANLLLPSSRDSALNFLSDVTLNSANSWKPRSVDHYFSYRSIAQETRFFHGKGKKLYTGQLLGDGTTYDKSLDGVYFDIIPTSSSSASSLTFAGDKVTLQVFSGKPFEGGGRLGEPKWGEMKSYPIESFPIVRRVERNYQGFCLAENRYFILQENGEAKFLAIGPVSAKFTGSFPTDERVIYAIVDAETDVLTVFSKKYKDGKETKVGYCRAVDKDGISAVKSTFAWDTILNTKKPNHLLALWAMMQEKKK